MFFVVGPGVSLVPLSSQAFSPGAICELHRFASELPAHPIKGFHLIIIERHRILPRTTAPLDSKRPRDSLREVRMP